MNNTEISQENRHLRPIPEIASALGVTDRRVRQWIEAGDVPRPERGRADIAWCMYFHAGSQIAAKRDLKLSAPAAVALGWAAGAVIGLPAGVPPTQGDVALFVALAERNGVGRDQAMQAIGRALGLLGR